LTRRRSGSHASQLGFSKATGGAARIIRSLNAAGVEVSLKIRISYVAQSEINFSSGWTLEHETSDWCPGQQFFRRSSETFWKVILRHSFRRQKRLELFELFILDLVPTVIED
jgi:hypothetical protein